MNFLDENMKPSEVDKRIKKYVNTTTFKNKIKGELNQNIKNNPELEKIIVDITKNSLEQLFKTLWVKRSFWSNQIKK